MRLFSTLLIILALGVFAGPSVALASGAPTCSTDRDSFGIAPSTGPIPLAQDHIARTSFGVSNGDSDTKGNCRLKAPPANDASLH